MKNYNEVTAEGAYPLHLANIFACFYVFFSPEIWLLLLTFAVDLLMLVGVYFVDARFFLKLFPQFKWTFQKEDIEHIGRLNSKEQIRFLEDLFSYPAKRAIWVFLVSFLKVIPVGYLLIHVNPNGMGEKWLQWIQFYALEAFAFSYFMGTVHIELHKFISNKIAQYHDQFNWETAFKKLSAQKNEEEFLRFESVALVFSITGLLVLTVLITLVSGRRPTDKLILDILLIQGTSLLCIVKLYTMNRKYFIDSLNATINYFRELNPAKKVVVPAHSSSVLTKFSQAFNFLSDKLSSREKELVEWMNYEIEQSHYKSIGQISGLIVHDLAGPIQALNMISEEIKTLPMQTQQKFLVDNLGKNARYVMELVESLKIYLKNTPQQETIRFIDVHESILNILKTQFLKQEFESIDVQLDNKLLTKTFHINRQTLAHILYNIYKNSFTNMIKTRPPNATIRVYLHSNLNSDLVLRFQDNGSGLSAEEFDEITSMQTNFQNTPLQRAGLGLRLTRRLIESQGGSLSLVETHQDGTLLEVNMREGKAFSLRQFKKVGKVNRVDSINSWAESRQ